jgi:hypothetical protein
MDLAKMVWKVFHPLGRAKQLICPLGHLALGIQVADDYKWVDTN